MLSHELNQYGLHDPLNNVVLGTPDVLLVDANQDLRRARDLCVMLEKLSAAPILLIATEYIMPALSTEWGFTDFILPGAGLAEIELRLRLTKAIASASQNPTKVKAEGIVIDEANFTAKMHDRPLDLAYKEFELLHYLVANAGRVFTREQLLSEVWGTDYYGGTRTVDVHIRRLRAKLGDNEGLIATVRGVGYGFARKGFDDADSEDSDEHNDA